MNSEVAECGECAAAWVGDGAFDAALEHMRTSGCAQVKASGVQV